MACPMRSESDASGDTFSCLDVPNSAYISPGIDAENYQPGLSQYEETTAARSSGHTKPVIGFNLARDVAYETD